MKGYVILVTLKQLKIKLIFYYIAQGIPLYLAFYVYDCYSELNRLFDRHSINFIYFLMLRIER